MAFRKASLEAVGGFDPQFRVAGDDVDICWRFQERGFLLGFSPAAVVWHHRRNSIRAYWKQQKGYGKAEALLEKKWPEKYNGLGHLNWGGRVYGKGLTRSLGFRQSRIYHGVWGCAAFQSIYQPGPGTFSALPAMPEWYLIIISLIGLSILGFLWPPMFLSLFLLLFASMLSVAQAAHSAARARFSMEPTSRLARLKWKPVTAFLHLIQPLARLYGRLRHGLSPWRFQFRDFSFPWLQTLAIWSEQWKTTEERLRSVEASIRNSGLQAYRAGDYDRWDLNVRGGVFGAARIRMAIEEHGAGKQLVRFRLWPRCSGKAVVLVVAFIVLSVGAAFAQASTASLIIGGIALLFAVRVFQECAGATSAALNAALSITPEEERRQTSEAVERNEPQYPVTDEQPYSTQDQNESELLPVSQLEIDDLNLERVNCANMGD
jgi:hypothetical protein